jgi:hypothetical protein
MHAMGWAGLVALVTVLSSCGEDDAAEPGSAPGGSAGAVSTTGGSAGTGGNPVAEPRSLLAACRAYTRAVCERRWACGLGDDVESCTSIYAYACPDHLFAPGSTRTAEGAFACAAEVPSYSCDALGRGITIPCAPVGTRATGEPCISPIQCQSFNCSGSRQACGACLPLVGAGEPCESGVNACPEGYQCAGTCVPRGASAFPPPQVREAGEVCNSNDQCPEGTQCSEYTHTETGTCQPPPEVGEACAASWGISSLACADTGYCDHTILQCVARPVAGGACSTDLAELIPCAPGHRCVVPASGVFIGTCVASVPRGGTCTSPSDGITPSQGECLEGLTCSPDGICLEMIPEGYACAAGDLCEIRTACVAGICTADDSMALYTSLCGG